MSPDSTHAQFAESDDTVTFIDYVPPPPNPVPPPAKYKLWLFVYVLVCVLLIFEENAEVTRAFRFHGYLGEHAALFLSLCLLVGILVYSSLDLMVMLLSVKIGETTYGLEAWMKMPRIVSIKASRNVLVQLLASVVNIFEEGFEIFNNPQATKSPTKAERFMQTCPENCQVVLKIEHRISPDMSLEYDEWQERIKRVAKAQPGFVRVSYEKSKEYAVCRRTIYLTFASLDTLNDWITSPLRSKLVEELQPMLLAGDVLQLVKDRNLPDAFTDLLTTQGEFVPPSLPKKWKVCWLTSCGLFFTILSFEQFLPYYFDVWGLSDEHPRLRTVVSSFFTTWFNSFVATPLFLLIFSDWVRRKPGEHDTQEPWRTLNDGFQTTVGKAILTLGFIVGCTIKWLVSTT